MAKSFGNDCHLRGNDFPNQDYEWIFSDSRVTSKGVGRVSQPSVSRWLAQLTVDGITGLLPSDRLVPLREDKLYA